MTDSEAREMARGLVRGSIIEDAASQFIAQVLKEAHDSRIKPLRDRIEELETKLAKAVEECAQIAESHKPSAALLSDRYWRGVDEAAHSIAYEIYTTLAELTGGKDE